MNPHNNTVTHPQMKQSLTQTETLMKNKHKHGDNQNHKHKDRTDTNTYLVLSSCTIACSCYSEDNLKRAFALFLDHVMRRNGAIFFREGRKMTPPCLDKGE